MSSLYLYSSVKDTPGRHACDGTPLRSATPALPPLPTEAPHHGMVQHSPQVVYLAVNPQRRQRRPATVPAAVIFHRSGASGGGGGGGDAGRRGGGGSEIHAELAAICLACRCRQVLLRLLRSVRLKVACAGLLRDRASQYLLRIARLASEGRGYLTGC